MTSLIISKVIIEHCTRIIISTLVVSFQIPSENQVTLYTAMTSLIIPKVIIELYYTRIIISTLVVSLQIIDHNCLMLFF